MKDASENGYYEANLNQFPQETTGQLSGFCNNQTGLMDYFLWTIYNSIPIDCSKIVPPGEKFKKGRVCWQRCASLPDRGLDDDQGHRGIFFCQLKSAAEAAVEVVGHEVAAGQFSDVIVKQMDLRDVVV